MKANNYAFIDGNNLYLGAKSQNIKLDYRKFRLYLRHKLGVKNAYLFVGYDARNSLLYARLQQQGYILVFKPTVFFVKNGKETMKGNVDAELVLYAAAIEFDNYEKAVIVTSDGDFACLVKYLDEKEKIQKIITPTKRHSTLFRPYLKYVLPLKAIA